MLKQPTLSGPSSSSSSSSSSIPAGWAWVAEIIGEAHLPHLALPVNWKKTEDEHVRIAYDPHTKRSINLADGKVSKYVSSPVGFIKSTANKNPMPGTNRPDSLRYERFLEKEFQDALVEDAHGNKLVPCLVHGDYVKVESLQADHLKAKEKILARQKDLVEKLNADATFAAFVMSLKGMDKFFVKAQMPDDSQEKYYGTLFFYELYFNDIDNIWLICQSCNLQKSNQDTIEWLAKQWLYGKDFLDYLGTINDEAILAKTQGQEGLAEVAIRWFWDVHATYISIAKSLFEKVDKPIKLLGIQVDHIIRTGRLEEAERLEASTTLRLEWMANIAKMSGIQLPDPSENQLSVYQPYVHNDKGQTLHPSMTSYQAAGAEVSKAIPTIVSDVFNEAIEEQMRKRKEPLPSDSQPKVKK